MNSWTWLNVKQAFLPSLLGVVLLLPLAGCSESTTSRTAVKTASPDTTTESASSDSGNETENDEVFEELVPFDAPSLEEIDATANWVDHPLKEVRDPLVERLKNSPPLVPAEEAMSLKNDSPEANDKIYSVVRQLPESDEQVDADATWVHYLNGDLKSLNPLMISASVEMELLDFTGLALVGFDADFNWFGLKSSIKSWQTSEDQMMDKFVLRDDLYWSDGEPVTAHDFVFSFQTIMNPKVTIPAVRASTQKLKWVEAYDDHTLVFFHKKALASNSGNISYPVVPEHIYKDSLADDYTMENSKYHQQFINKPLTCGPYEYKSRARGQNIILTRRDDYWQKDGKQIRPKPYFKEIRCEVITDPNTALLALKAGDIDDCILSPEQWLTQTDNADFYEKNTKVRGIEWTEFHIVWNVKRPYFQDKQVRKAIALAFDHQEMLSSIFYDLAPAGLGAFHPAGWMASRKPEAYKRNLDAAEDLLDEAGWGDSDGDGFRDKEINGRLVPFRFTLLSSNKPDSIKICTLMKSNLDQIGIQVDVKTMEFTVLQDKSLKHQFDAMIAGWGSGADPSTLENVFGTGGGRNYGEYSNTRVDELFEQGELEFDREKRAEYYSEIHEILWDDQPYLWLYYRPTFYGLNKDIRGFNFSPRDPFGVSPGIHGIWKTK